MYLCRSQMGPIEGSGSKYTTLSASGRLDRTVSFFRAFCSTMKRMTHNCIIYMRVALTGTPSLSTIVPALTDKPT